MLIKLEINRENIEKNLLKIEKINKNTICVLKDDAYGLGIENIIPILIEKGCCYFAVSYIEEALKIKKIINEKYKKESKKVSIMTLNFIEDKYIEKAIKNGIEITIFSIEQLENYLKKFKNENKMKIHIKVNTGMNRLGFNEDEIHILIEKLIKNKNIQIKSVYSHISNSEDENKTNIQVERYNNIFEKFKEKYKNKKIYRHIQASPLLFKYKEKYNYDFARIGMAIYGMEPLSEAVGLESTVRITSKVINIRNIKKGENVSYGEKGIVKEDKKVAVIPIGYSHGLQKQIENNGAYVLINGKKAHILGEVCMDMIIVDVSHIKNVRLNDEVVIIGKQGNEEITLMEMANWAKTIQDDILTKWNKSIKRTIK